MNESDIQILLDRGVSQYIDPESTFVEKLKKNPKDIVIKFGVDPTRPDIHLGHAVVLRKLRAFQDVGCKVVFLIGDFTSLIGDPTGKSKVRPEIDQKEIEANMKTYLAQVGKILNTDPSVFSWIRNSDWFLNVTDIEPSAGIRVNFNSLIINPSSFVGKAVIFEESRMQKTHLKKNKIQTISFTRVLATLRHITHARLIERDMFQDRIKNGQELFMHEMLYPVLQGIDSQVISTIYGSCDLEVGGTDQTFNMIMGRDVMKMNQQIPQAVLSFKLLEGTDGVEKMSKSLDNYIGITDEPNDMYGKVMSIPDHLIEPYFELATPISPSELKQIKDDLLQNKINPRDVKMRLAKIIVAMYHGEKASEMAEQDFVTKFQKKEIPETIPEHTVEHNTSLVDFLITNKLVESKSDFSRLINQGAIKIVAGDGKKEQPISDPKTLINENTIIRIGKHRFVKILIQK